jgi:hypothetical protein
LRDRLTPAALLARLKARRRSLGMPYPGQIIGYRRDGRPIRLLAGGSGPALVQSKSAAGTSLTLTSATTAGNCLVVAVADFGSLSTPSVSAVKIGGAADNFAALVTSANTEKGLATIWADPSCTVSSTSITITQSAGVAPVIFAYEFSGVAGSSILDLSDSGTNLNGTWSSGTTGTTNQASEVWVGVGVVNAATPTGPSSPWTNQSLASSNTNGIAGYQITTSAAAAVYNGTSASAKWAAAVVTLKSATLISDSDTGTGADTGTVSVSSPDTGSGADTGSVTASVPGSDTGAGAETASVRVSGADAGTGADAATASLLVTGTDTGSGADTGSVTTVLVSGSDSGTGAESSTIRASLSAADTGAGAEAGQVLRRGVLWNAPDKLSKTGGAMG